MWVFVKVVEAMLCNVRVTLVARIRSCIILKKGSCTVDGLCLYNLAIAVLEELKNMGRNDK